MERRTFIKNASLTALGVSAFGILDAHSKQAVFGNNFKVNEQRIVNRIAQLSKFGLDEQGHGYRVAYTKGDIDGRAWFIEQMKRAGLDPAIDAAGNIIGKRKGKNPVLKPIAFASVVLNSRRGSTACAKSPLPMLKNKQSATIFFINVFMNF